MDVAALNLAINSDSVVKATADLDRFASASAKAGAAAGNQTGSIAKLVATVQSMNAKLAVIVGSLEKIASATKAASAANDNMAASVTKAGAAMAVADSHVIAYTQHLAGLAAAQRDANAHVIAYQNQVSTLAPKQAQANAHVEAYRKHLAALPAALDKASASAGALQSNTGNIAAQFQDIGVTAAMGMNPLIIGLQQGTQLSAVFAQSGGTMKEVLVGAFKQIASAQALATIGMVALIAVVIQLGIAWFNSASEGERQAKVLESIKFASDGVSDAQSILGKVFDLTTGKMKTQTAAAVNLAKAQLLLMKATAQTNISKTSSELDAAGDLGFGGRLSAYLTDRSLIDGSARVGLLTKALKEGRITGAQATEGFDRLAKSGQITNEMFLKATAAAANYGMEIENVKTATQGLADLEAGKLSEIFMNPTKAKKPPKGGKTDAEKLADVYLGAAADIAAEKTRALAEANSLGAYEAAKLEKQTALLNSIQQKGIPITDAVRKKVGELADEYAKFKIAADVSAVVNSATSEIDKQISAVEDQVKLVGLYGDALARATREMEAQKRLRDALPKGEIAVTPNLTGELSDKIEDVNRQNRMAKVQKDAEDFAYAMDLEQKGLALTGQAAIEYAYIVDQLNAARRAGIELSPAEVEAINAAGAAYASQRYAIDQQKQALADSREVTKGFFSDAINGAREGINVFTAFGNAAVNALNKIIDKLLDKTLNGFLDSMFSSGGGALGSILGGKTAAAGSSVGGSFSLPTLSDIGKSQSPNPWGSVIRNALGGAYGTAQRFAKGGTFTNSVVNTPTLFRFANGAALGEMGEAGPEAIMPLKRGPNGALGVAAHGAGRSGPPEINVSIQQDFHLTGTVSQKDVEAMSRQAAQSGAELAVTTVRREFGSMAAQMDVDGAMVG